MIDFSGKTYEKLLADLLAFVPDTFDKRDTSPVNTALGPAAYALAGFYIALDNVQRSGFVTTAVGDDLDELGVIAGISRYGASEAVRRGIFNADVTVGSRFSTPNNSSVTFIVTGSDTRPAISSSLNNSIWEALGLSDGTYEFEYNGAAWKLNSANVSLSHYGITESGTFYAGDVITVTQSSGTETITTTPSDLVVARKLTAETAGTSGNSYVGNILPITTIPGLTLCELTEVLVSGEDLESDEEFRTRIVEALKRRPFAGNVSAYREAALSVDGVGAAQIYPTWNGGGTVKIALAGAGDYKAVSSSVVSNVQTAIDPASNQGAGIGLAPIGAVVTVVSGTDFAINVSATLTIEAGYTIEAVREAVTEAIENYLLSLRKNWARQVSETNVSYSVTVYRSQIIAAILSVPHIENVSNLTLNNGNTDLSLTETSATQQIPVKGTITLA